MGLTKAVFDIYDKKGALMLSLNSKLTRFLGAHIVTDYSGVITIEKQQNEQLFAFASVISYEQNKPFMVQPIQIDIKDNQIFYRIENTALPINTRRYKIIYGVY